MQTSDSGATSKPSSKGKNARFADEQGEEQGTGYSHERWVLSISLPRLGYLLIFGYNRAFADYIFGSLILHFFCINFIN